MKTPGPLLHRLYAAGSLGNSATGAQFALTIPSLIVATHGGGTGLATQRECLDIVGCHGKGKANRLAEIIAAVALAGEISLRAALSSSD
jgi:hydroxymethylglutaryl-CoA reductase (NADPH)